jgi:hypothetical protein
MTLDEKNIDEGREMVKQSVREQVTSLLFHTQNT